MRPTCCVEEGNDRPASAAPLTYQQALARIVDAASRRVLSAETVPLTDIPGRVCAEDVAAPLDVQPFDNSAMDGFAVHAGDLAAASGDRPVTLESIETVAAGRMPQRMVAPGRCAEIMTGAPLPRGADAVVPVERVRRGEGRVIFTAPATAGDHVRRAGEDFRRGEPVLKAGASLGARHVMALATLGIDKVGVARRPRVGFIATGSEIVDDLSQPLKPGQIYNSNRPYAESMLQALGVDCVFSESMLDEPDTFARRLDGLAGQRGGAPDTLDIPDKADVIVSSGAVSAGKYDFIRQVLESRGAEILFHKVAIRPGKPNLFARLADGTLYFGLPGNPAAVAVGLRFFVWPALRAMAGLPPEQPLQGRLTNENRKKKGLRSFGKAVVDYAADGQIQVRILSKQQSFQTSPFLEMNAWAVAPEDAETIEKGSLVDVYPLMPPVAGG